MMDCPRCGFSQPKDQFCANCGINLQAVQPARKPLSQKLFANPWVIGSLVTVILASMIFYLQSRSPDTPEIGENTITRDEAFEQQRQQELAQAEEERRRRAEQRREQRARQEQDRQQQRTIVKAQASTAQAQANLAGSGGAEKAAATEPPKQLQMRFYEVPQNVLDQVYEKGQEVSASSVSRTLVVKNAAELTAVLQGGKPVGGVKNWNAAPGEAQTSNYTNLSDEPKELNYDMNLEVVVNRATGEGLNYQFRGDLFLAEGEDNPPPIEIPSETHEVPANGAMVVVGFLPHQGLSEEAPQELLRPPLTVMGTPEFRNSDTEFLIVLTPK